KDIYGKQDSCPNTAAKAATVESPPAFSRAVDGPFPPRLRPAVDGGSPGARAWGTAVTGFLAAGAGAIRLKPKTEKPRERGSKKKRCVSLGPALDPASRPGLDRCAERPINGAESPESRCGSDRLRK